MTVNNGPNLYDITKVATFPIALELSWNPEELEMLVTLNR